MASLRSQSIPIFRNSLCTQCQRTTSSLRQPFLDPQRLSSARPRSSLHPRPISAARLYSVSSPAPKIYNFNQIKQLSTSPQPDQILIDVREPSEYEAGHIGSAINIPVKSQPDALFLAAEEFEDRFGFEKPGLGREVVFYCRSGVRSSSAAELARQSGYTNVAEYKGSWVDWEKNGGEVSRP